MNDITTILSAVIVRVSEITGMQVLQGIDIIESPTKSIVRGSAMRDITLSYGEAAASGYVSWELTVGDMSETFRGDTEPLTMTNAMAAFVLMPNPVSYIDDEDDE